MKSIGNQSELTRESHFWSVFLKLPVGGILGDPGTIRGGGENSKRARKKFGQRKAKNERKKAILLPFTS